jgi:DNA-binding HxlR family transcriptional regulator
MHAVAKNPTITETKSLHRLCRFGHVQRMEENRIPKRVLYMNLEKKQEIDGKMQ